MSTPIAQVQQTYPAPNRNQLAAEGSYLIAVNPTVSTGLTWVAAQTTFVDTGPNFWIHNNEPSGGRTLYLDFIKLISTAVGTAAVSWQYAVIVDSIARTITTDHTLAVAAVCPASGYSPIAAPTIQAQNSATASVFTASSASAKKVARGALGGLNIAGRVLGVSFGDLASASSFSGTNDTAGNPGAVWSSSGPVAVNPGQDCSIYFWAPSSSASINPEFEIGMIARP